MCERPFIPQKYIQRTAALHNLLYSIIQPTMYNIQWAMSQNISAKICLVRGNHYFFLCGGGNAVHLLTQANQLYTDCSSV